MVSSLGGNLALAQEKRMVILGEICVIAMTVPRTKSPRKRLLISEGTTCQIKMVTL